MGFNKVEFGKRVRKLRQDSGVLQDVLSNELNISSRELRKIETGDRGPSLDVVIALGNYFDVSMDYLLIGKKVPENMSEKQKMGNIIKDLTEIQKKMPG